MSHSTAFHAVKYPALYGRVCVCVYGLPSLTNKTNQVACPQAA